VRALIADRLLASRHASNQLATSNTQNDAVACPGACPACASSNQAARCGATANTASRGSDKCVVMAASAPAIRLIMMMAVLPPDERLDINGSERADMATSTRTA